MPWRERGEFWRGVPRASRIALLAGVFLLFATMGFVQLLMVPVRQTVLSTIAIVCIYGGFAVGYALLSILRKFRWLPLWGLLHAGAFFIVGNIHHPPPQNRADLQKQMTVLGVCATVSIAIGYILFIFFIRREGNRYFRIQAEIELAREIHRSLVPSFERTIDGFEVFGASVASGEVGGDLVDIVEHPSGWMSYIADISGHGVSSGVLMAMFKTSVRSRLSDGGSPGELLAEVHRTLFPLKMPNMFVTAGVLQFCASNGVNFSLAGHPPLLRYSRVQCSIVEYDSQNMPLGILPEQSFAAARLQCDPGDVLLLLTDGFSEVFNGHGAELGIDPLKQEFQKAADRPLPEIFDRLRKLSLSFGRQDDDQTLLLVRCTS
ncbi:MAG TPA: PP2C family protein-serine/threonine phosphatase [Terriglobales bacterium]|nr:PP2C family protein-serine/threonine phosphatase [Terriglobales bacterium]